MRVLIKTPDKDDKFSISFGSGSRRRNSASVILSALKRKLRGYTRKEKIVVKVKYSKDTTNTTLPSLDTKYILYATSCFLEDYLKTDHLLKLQRDYER